MSEGFSNPVTNAIGVLVRSALQSFNFVAGIAGWQITKAGAAELNNATIRGSLSAGSGNVLLNSGGLHIQGSGVQYDINIPAGFLGRNFPDNGVLAQVANAGFFLSPQNPSPAAVATLLAGIFTGFQNSGLANEQIFTTINASNYNGKVAPFITMYSQAANDAGSDDTSAMRLSANTIIPVTDFTLKDNQNHYYLAGENQLFNLGILSTDASVTVAVTFTHAFTRAPMVACNINDTAGATGKWTARAINITTTGFTFWVQSPTGTAAGSAVTLKCTWMATEYTP